MIDLARDEAILLHMAQQLHDQADETVRPDANTERGMPWEFRPMEREMTVRLGENGLAFYEAYNPTSKPVAGTASFNVTPYSAGNYFVKVECFCFTEQVLMPGERVEMPVSFYVDPELLGDREAALRRRSRFPTPSISPNCPKTWK